MRRSILLVSVLSAICGCSAQRQYAIVLQIKPADEPGQFVVGSTIAEDWQGAFSGGSRTYGGPVIQGERGKEMSTSVRTDDGRTGLEMKAYIARPGESRDTTAELKIMRDGRIEALNRVILPTPPAGAGDAKSDESSTAPDSGGDAVSSWVAAYDSANGLAILNIGSDSRPPAKLGDTFWIVRGGRVVTQVRVTAVDNHRSKAKVVSPRPGRMPRRGDRAIGAP
jgi:hypothetical protein